MRKRQGFDAARKRVFNTYEFEHPTYPGRPVHSSTMLTLLGVTGKLPPEGMAARDVQGVRVWVRPLPDAAPGQRKRSAHRVRCACPGCGLKLSAGRLFQHWCEATD
jgi:hypothetical protein